MKNRGILCVCFALLICGILCACGSGEHQHDWTEADCSHPAACKTCGEPKGEPLGHDWTSASCTQPETCRRCGMQGAEALGHSWQETGCTEPDRCLRCGAASEEIRGHEFAPASYYAPETCQKCGAQQGMPLEGSVAARGLNYRTVDLSAAAGRSFAYLTGTKSGTSSNTTSGSASANWIFAIDKDASEESEPRTAQFRLPEGSMAAAEKFDMDYLPDEEGYEWLGVKITASFGDIKYKSRGVKTADDFTDFYTGDYVFEDYAPETGEDEKKSDDGISMQKFSVEYLGNTYENCLLVRRFKQTDTDENGTAVITLFCRVPAGYDGCMVMLYNSQNTIEKSDSEEEADEEQPIVLDQADGDTLLFRFR